MMFSAPMNDTDSSSVLPDQTCQRLTLAEIQLVTRNFDETFVIGRGGFGNVYKCSTKIGSTKQVAVKRLNSMSNQGAHEFEAEVQILSKLRHGNLVSLTGYCNEGNEMALVYEFMPNGTLEDNLRKPDSCLSWLQRLTICIGAARGLDYLHTGTSTQHGVIHRDVKSSNILLDANFDAKISDFGLAKVGLIDRTHMSTAVKGTFGYMDPCYFYTGNLTIKSDVYAFGVILFEILSGRKAVDSTLDEEQWSLAAWAQHQIKVGKLNQIIDPKLIGQISKKCLKDFARIAGQCLHTLPKQRPTMAEVFVKLEFILSQERESSNSVVDEERFIYKLRSFFSGKADADIGSKYDLSDIDDEIESESDCSIHRELILIEDGGAIESNKEQSLRTFTYTELASATNGFEKEVYSPTSTESIYIGWVAERTYAPTKHGVGLAIYVRRMEILEWQKVIKLEKFNHPNIVKLLGYCLSNRALYCVYELIPGTSLDECLYGEPSTKPLSWVARLNIAIGAAEGHFHSQKRNQPAYNQFKTSFILVDMDFNARLSDFSFGPNTYMIDRYYEAPVWFGYRKDDFAMKDAIYTFGVILLEILTGLKVYDERRSLPKQNLVEWATPLLEDEMNMGMIMDPKLQDYHCSPKGVFRLAVLV